MPKVIHYAIRRPYRGPGVSPTPVPPDPDPDNDATNTNGLLQQVIWSIGDSIAKGFSSDGLRGPTPTPGTVYEWTGSALVEVGSNDLTTASTGSMWPKFGIDYNAGSGFKPVFAAAGVNSSRFNSTTANLSWDTNGTLYGLAETKCDQALAAVNLTRPRLVHIHLGENEYSAATVADSIAAMYRLIDRINLKYSSPPIWIDIPGVNGLTINASHGLLRWAILDLPSLYSNVQVAINTTSLYSWGYLFTDVLHPIQVGYNKMGEILARLVLSTETNGVVKRILCGFDTILPTAKAEAVKAYLTFEQLADRWRLNDSMQVYCMDTQRNAMVDWSGVTSPRLIGAPSFVAGQGFVTDGVDDAVSTFFRPATLQRSGSQNDFIVGVHSGVNNTPAGTLAHLFGGTSGARLLLGQNASSQVMFRAITATDITHPTNTKIPDNMDQKLRRTSSSFCEYLQNAVSVRTSTLASVTPTTDEIWNGARNGTNVGFEFMANTFRRFQYGRASSYDVAAELANFEAMRTVLMS